MGNLIRLKLHYLEAGKRIATNSTTQTSLFLASMNMNVCSTNNNHKKITHPKTGTKLVKVGEGGITFEAGVCKKKKKIHQTPGLVILGE